MSAAPEDVTLTAPDGVDLAATLFRPEAGNGIAVQLNAATGVPRQYYAAFSEFLAARGFTVLTYDYRGIGGSHRGHLRAARGRMLDWGTSDQSAATSWLSRHHRELRLAIVGHSLGGQILGLSPLVGETSAVLLIATQHGYFRNWPVASHLRMAFLWYLFAPATSRVMGYFPGRLVGLSDLPGGVAREWARWCRNPHYISDEAGAPLRPFNNELRAPLRLISFSDDPIAPRRAAERLLDFYPNAERRHDHLAPEHFGVDTIGHFGFFRRSMPQSAWADAADWLAARA